MLDIIKDFFKNNKIATVCLYALMVAVIFAVFIFVLKVTHIYDFLNMVENKTFDFRQKIQVTSKTHKASKDIVLITIDDASYEYLTTKYGEWPLDRSVYADLINYIEAQNPASISFDLMFVSSLKNYVGADNKLTQAMSSYDNVLTGMSFDNMAYDVREPINLPARLQLTVNNKSDVDFDTVTFSNCRAIISQILNSNIKVGILNVVRSSDGIIREFPAVVKYQNDFYPNLAFLTALNYQSKVDKTSYNTISIDKNSNILIGNKKLPINTDGGLILNWYGPSDGKTFKHIPLYKLVKLMNGEQIDETYDFNNKIIFVGTTTSGLGDIKSTPVTGTGETYPGVEIYATFMNNFIDGNFIHKVTPATNILLTLFLVAIVGTVVLRTNSNSVAITTAISTLIVYSIFANLIMLFANIWLDLVLPIIAIISIFVISYIIKYIIKSRDFDYQYKLATTDGLTELFNHRYFQDQLRMNIDSSKRYNGHVSLIIVDIDHFKSFNDTYGHQAGDAVLRQVAQTIKRNVRATDIVCRYGGEEMSVILTNTDKEDALFNAKRVRKAVAERMFKLNATQEKHVTISVGVSTYPMDGETNQELIQVADDGLYYAKEHGRNQVGISGVLTDSQKASLESPENQQGEIKE
mgnify:CR=1 FL=1